MSFDHANWPTERALTRMAIAPGLHRFEKQAL